MKTSTKILASLALSSSLIFGGAMAMGSGNHHKGHGDKIERMAKKLDLTEAQTTKIQALVDAHKASNPKKDRSEMKDKRKAMKAQHLALLNSPTFDEATIRERLAERASAHADRKVEKMRLKHSIYQVLNEEQRAKFLTMMDKKKRKMKKRMRKHMKKHRHERDSDNHTH